MGFAYFEKSSTVMIPYLYNRANSTILSSGLSMAVFSCMQLYSHLELVSPWIPGWSNVHSVSGGNVKMFDQNIFICFFFASVRSVSTQSNRSKNLVPDFVLSCGLSFFNWVQLFLWRFVSVLGCDPRVCQDFQVSGIRKCCFAARVCSFWGVRLGRQSDQDHLVNSYWGLPYLLVWCTWIAPEWLRRVLHGDNEICIHCIGNPDCYSLVIYCRPWKGNQQTCCIGKLLQRCYSTCCVPFGRMVDKGRDCFLSSVVSLGHRQWGQVGVLHLFHLRQFWLALSSVGNVWDRVLCRWPLCYSY